MRRCGPFTADVRGHLLYVFANDDHTLAVYRDASDAIAACEGVDVADGNYQFFDSVGRPLKARFLEPNSQGAFFIKSGRYTLEPVLAADAGSLQSVLKQVCSVTGAGLNSVTEVAALVELASREGATVPSNKSLERSRDR